MRTGWLRSLVDFFVFHNAAFFRVYSVIDVLVHLIIYSVEVNLQVEVLVQRAGSIDTYLEAHNVFKRSTLLVGIYRQLHLRIGFHSADSKRSVLGLIILH